MVIDDDDSDLYPPDVEELTPELRQQRNRAIAGVTLVGIGFGLLLERAVGREVDFWWLSLGLGLIAGWFQAPRFILFAVGAILVGFGGGDFVAGLIHTPFETPINTLFAAAGFLAVYARYPQRARWALCAAAVFGLLTVAAVGIELIGLIPAMFSGAMLPLLLIAGGGLLMFRNRLPGPVVRVGLVVIAVAFVIAASSSVDRWDGPDFSMGHREATLNIVGLDGRTLVVDDNSSSDITIRTGDKAFARVSVRGPVPPRLDLDRSDGEVRLSARSGGRFRSISEITVPPGTDLRIVRGSGDIDAELDGGDVELTTESGEITLDLLGGTSEDDYVLESGSGDININTHDAEPEFDVHTNSGEIDVEDEDVDEDTYTTEGDGQSPSVDVVTGAGDVEVEAA